MVVGRFRGLKSPCLTLLLEAVSREFLNCNDPHSIAYKLEACGSRFLPGTAGARLHFANNLTDAKTLLNAGRMPDAVWPLRMAGAMMAAAVADELGVPYNGLGDVARFCDELSDIEVEISATLNELFLLSSGIPVELRAYYALALRSFKKEWDSSVAELSAESIVASANVPMRSTPELAQQFISGKGLWLKNTDGHLYLDAISGTFNLPFGYNHPQLNAAVADQLSLLTHVSSTFADAGAKNLVTRLVQHAGGKIDTGLVRDCTGSTAIECAVKIAQKFTCGSDIITLYYSHHGQTLFTSAISNDSSRRLPFPAATSAGVVRVPAPYCHRCFYKQNYANCGLLCADRISDIVEHTSQGRLAALIIEPILGNGGNIPLPIGYAERICAFCDSVGILLIADEVQTGLGRTGEILASPGSGLDPDIIVLAKNLGGIGLPIGAVLVRAEIMKLLRTEHSFSSGGNLLAIAAAHATLDLLEVPGFMQDVRRKGVLLGELLNHLKRHRCVGEIRGRGLMWGIELEHDDQTPAVDLVNRAIELSYSNERLILRGSRYGRGNVLKIRPSLIASEDELREIAERLDRVLARLGN